GFEKIADVEQAGDPLEQLQGVFGVRLRTARMQLGRECLDLTEYLAPHGRPPPADARSNDRYFQHAAIVIPDMDRDYAALRAARRTPDACRRARKRSDPLADDALHRRPRRSRRRPARPARRVRLAWRRRALRRKARIRARPARPRSRRARVAACRRVTLPLRRRTEGGP